MKTAFRRINGNPSNALKVQKENTPSFGGVIIFVTLIAHLVVNFFYLDVGPFWIYSFLTACTFAVGLLDDIIKFSNSDTVGLKALHKLFLISFSCLLIFYVADPSIIMPKQYIPLYGWLNIPQSYYAYYLLYFIVVHQATVHAVNLTDGLDGLATSLTIVTLAGLMFASYYLGTDNFPNTSLMYTLVVAVSVLVTFFYFNKYPAVIFLGDSGSFLLGSLISVAFLSTGLGLVLPFFGVIFVLETLSVILQVLWFKCFGKRIFKCAPIHHHFQFMGCHESKITFIMILIQLVSVVFFSWIFFHIYA
ncbi:hypothetical protein N9N03_01775 [Chlamydiia bacterium]|nr:hypothetical protein [Chlamydiia bacterium]